VTGRLAAFEPTEDTGRATVVVDDTGEHLELPLAEIRMARLEIEL